MADQESAQPLLHDQEVTSAWDRQDVETVSGSARRIGTVCTVEQMFTQHPQDVLNFLQTSGVEKLAEFRADVGVEFFLEIFEND
jgi:hypothetical protein